MDKYFTIQNYKKGNTNLRYSKADDARRGFINISDSSIEKEYVHSDFKMKKTCN